MRPISFLIGLFLLLFIGYELLTGDSKYWVKVKLNAVVAFTVELTCSRNRCHNGDIPREVHGRPGHNNDRQCLSIRV